MGRARTSKQTSTFISLLREGGGGRSEFPRAPRIEASGPWTPRRFDRPAARRGRRPRARWPRSVWRQVKACLRPRARVGAPYLQYSVAVGRHDAFVRQARQGPDRRVVCNSRDPVPRAVGVVFDVYIQVPEGERAGIAASQNDVRGQNSN